MFCKNCGRELDGTQKFCPGCGTPQTTNAGVQTPINVNVYSAPQGGGQASTGSTGNTTSGGYQSSGGYQTPGTSEPGPLATDRSLITYILLSLVTCGIYGWYFLYCMARDVNIACDGDGETTPGLGMLILLSLLTCGIYGYYWYYKLGNRLCNNAPRYGLTFQENGTTIIIWCLVGYLICGIGSWIAMHMLIKNTNTICAAYNNYVSRR